MSGRAAALRGTRAVLVLGAVAALAACAGESSVRCEGRDAYMNSTSAPPVRVPEGLSVPSEDDALRVPPTSRVTPRGAEGSGQDGGDGEDAGDGDADATAPCLEQPPEYFEGGEREDGAA